MMTEGGGPWPVERHVQIKEADFDDIMRTLNWVKESPGCHPENIRKELMRIHDKLLNRNYCKMY